MGSLPIRTAGKVNKNLGDQRRAAEIEQNIDGLQRNVKMAPIDELLLLLLLFVNFV